MNKYSKHVCGFGWVHLQRIKRNCFNEEEEICIGPNSVMWFPVISTFLFHDIPREFDNSMIILWKFLATSLLYFSQRQNIYML